MGLSIGIAAGKDGSGKTFFATNLAAMLAQGGASVCLVDLNYGSRGLDLALGLESEVIYDLGDVFSGDATLRQAEVVDDRFSNLVLYSCPEDYRRELPSQAQVKGLYDQLKKMYDFVVVELPGGPDSSLLGLSAGLDKAVLVVTPEADVLRNAESVNEILRARGIGSRFVLLNKVKSEFYEPGKDSTVEDVVELLRIPLLGVILEDNNIYYSLKMGKPVVTEDSSVTDTFRRICLAIV